nr:MAG TPA: hypothetical protein [Caudoviricetes sp.]
MISSFYLYIIEGREVILPLLKNVISFFYVSGFVVFLFLWLCTTL